MNKIQAIIVADSIDPRGNRITSFLLTIPQIVVKELLRHRMFSFSSSSMRAIPFNKVLQDTKENMFVPIAFQSHHSGMQGTSYLTGKEAEDAKTQWLQSGLKACEEAEKLYNLGVTKQICSRIIEPYNYAKILVTATEFSNFFELRCPKFDYLGQKLYKSRKDAIKETNASLPYDNWYSWQKMNKSQAEIHIQALAEAMWDAFNESTPKHLEEGEYHIPFGDKINLLKLAKVSDIPQDFYRTECEYDEDPNSFYQSYLVPQMLKIATANCARISYNNHDGEINYQKDIELHDRLLASHHMSPFEHCARVMFNDEYATFVKGRLEDYTSTMEGYNPTKEMQGWCNNFRGFIQYRYLIENEKI